MTAPRTYTDGIALAGSVSRTIAKGPHHLSTKSTERGTRVRGYRLRYAGYEVTDADHPRSLYDDEGNVRCTVTWRMSSDTVAWSKDHDRTLQAQHAKVEALHAHLTANAAPGWNVGPIEYGDLHGYAWFRVAAPSRYAEVAS